ncbi:NADP-dependent oxidoreductase [Amycolatopsis sp. FDAARGOS 1241]|uniref:NADP-dependent oxidoreductase n=1 Tax=Amycolatopsis sp. FDAARGOS 1241 TaxID=2778070 RepID=UPI001951B44F|nr:NADP-dependent oxidoreductase [Amycolatopsis sp. FDAARGOS 1241]QRP48646.1 NADP-dependent oxidoreductase [Amycolatopsis sp. FDAARGOS 1241]
MRAAGVREIGGGVEVLELSEPDGPGPGEVVIEVAAAGVGNWDDIVRAGAWNVGLRPPMALGVEVAGTVIAVGSRVRDLRVGDAVLGHPLPLRHQGCWAERVVVDAGLVVVKPRGVSWETAAAFSVPALTAEQVLAESLTVAEDETLLVHGGGSTTGGLVVQLAAGRGVRVVATAGPSSAGRVARAGAAEVVDYHDSRWPDRVRELTGGVGVDAAVNAVPAGSAEAMVAVREGGRMATITGDPPAAERGISVADVYVRPDPAQLAQLCGLLAEGRLTLSVGTVLPLAEAATALERAVSGNKGGPVVLHVGTGA